MTRVLRSALVPLAAALALLGAPSAGAAPTRDYSQPVPQAERVAPVAAERYAHERTEGAEHDTHGPVLLRTRPIRAPHRFDLVGIAGEMDALEYRSRRSGERWSDWVETENGDPVYTGPADQVQIRSHGTPIEGELHYVDLGDLPSAAPEPEPSAERRRGPPRPKFVSRASWGANSKKGGCEPRDKPTVGQVKAGVIHHTVSTNTYSESAAPGIVLGICRFHRNGNGWDDIGYNALVDRFGNLYEGRAGGLERAIVGAQAEGHNSQTTGIATIATHTDVGATSAERRGLIRYLAWKLDLHGISAAGTTWLRSAGGESTRTPKGKRVKVGRILSHSDTNFTECAGTKLRKQIPSIRRATQRRIDKYGGGSPEPEEPDEPGGGATP